MAKGKKEGFAFAKINYRIMLLGIALLVIGFLLMAGGGSDDPNVFNPEIFSFRRITLAPIVVLAGFATVMFAIMKKVKE
jgi:membrane-bound ClpP family serine protease